ncbi:hypothetical protein HOY34_00735 [Xinfangfangia sp. D13-10-4-6]|uniref:hypothetical protein n=1 Tax=Pseudogemmobacter hezensis TaxID=2737662 RepID=UPI0015538A97|nr:hypothetical protein [Pseudogemmobacter hezensis]NPD13724.1 hypothetical protein [Pseudogemmobacter hezensis]
MTESTQIGGITRRKVFYLPGYDPFHPRRYRELYRKEGAAQAALSGYALALQPKKAGGPYGWQVQAQIEGADVTADIEVLVWSDIVKGSMSETIPATYLQLFRTSWAYIGSGALFRLMRLRKGPMIAALYPIVFLLLQLALALALGWLGFALVAHYLHWATGLPVWGALTWGVLNWFRKKDNKVFAWYLMHDYAYSAQFKGANPPELEARMFDFGKQIQAALREDYDEVLVVGHSSGAHLGVSILADLLRQGGAGHGPDQGPKLSFLSLGQVVPMVSFLPDARRLRADLAFLSTQDQITWIDVTAPGDGCAFALCDPVSVSVTPPEGKRWPLVLSAAFTQTLTPGRWRELRRRWFRLHFQYLCAFDNLTGAPGEYDYFRITAGPQTLGARFKNRQPSKSRIEQTLNRYRTIA